MYCKVRGCRYEHEHITSHHQCGKCKLFGHGRLECSDENKKKELEIYFEDKMKFEQRCKIRDCIRKETHTTLGHCCRYCGTRDKHLKQCPNNPINPTEILYDPTSIGTDPRQNAEKLELKFNTYDSFSAGMGCTWYVRNNHGNLEYCFIHSDSWGQYGEDTSDIPILNAFLEGYTTN